MRTATFSRRKTSSLAAPVLRLLLMTGILLAIAPFNLSRAQATLSVQGILKKANGEAVADGSYNLTFKLYTQASGGTAIWTEAQTNVDVVSGIYSTVLGNITSLNVAFNQLYYLGVTVGSTEMTPRIQLTSAPYALSMIGSTNQFPSSGLVLADSIKVNGGVLAKGGAPGVNGANRNGYAFTGNSGDKDSGLFSTSDGEVSLYVNNVELLEVKPGQATLNGDLLLPSGGNLRYNGLDDWRLVVVEDFETGPNGWKVYAQTGGEHIGWNNPTPIGDAPVAGSNTDFQGKYLAPAYNGDVLKKQYDLSNVGTFTTIKIKFRYHFLDSHDPHPNDRGVAAFATAANGTGLRVGWMHQGFWANATYALNTNPYVTTVNYGGVPSQPSWSDYWIDGEMTGNKNGSSNSFWLFFMNAHDTGEEDYGVGMIEIWVR